MLFCNGCLFVLLWVSQVAYDTAFSTLRPQVLVEKDKEQYLEANNFREQMAMYKDLRQQHSRQVGVTLTGFH